MNTTILQVPVSKQLRADAAQAALSQGFSSLQEAVRVFLNQLATQQTAVRFEPVVKLSKKNELKYTQIMEDIESGKAKTHEYTSFEEYMKFLKSGSKI